MPPYGMVVPGRTPWVGGTVIPDPTVWFAPDLGEAFEPGARVPLALELFTSGAGVTSVEFRVNDTPIATLTAPPWCLDWTAAEATGSVVARVTTALGVVDSERQITVLGALPSVYSLPVVSVVSAFRICPSASVPMGGTYWDTVRNWGSVGGVLSVPPLPTSYSNNETDHYYNTRLANCLVDVPVTTAGRPRRTCFGDGRDASGLQARASIARSAYRCLHDGTGCTIFAVVCRRSGVPSNDWAVAEDWATDGSPGAIFGINPTGAPFVRIDNGVSFLVNLTHSATVTVNAHDVVCWHFDAAGGGMGINGGSETTWGALTYSQLVGGALRMLRGTNGHVLDVVVYPGNLGLVDRASILASLQALHCTTPAWSGDTRPQFVVEGDCWSIGTTNVSWAPGGGQAYGWQAFVGTLTRLHLSGVYGNQALSRLHMPQAASRVDAHYDASRTSVISEFTDGDDLNWQGLPGWAYRTLLDGYHLQRKLLGWRTLSADMPRRCEYYSVNAEAQRVEYNAALAAHGLAHADAVVNISNVWHTRLGASIRDGVLYSGDAIPDDGGHPTQLGYDIWGRIIRPQLRSLVETARPWHIVTWTTTRIVTLGASEWVENAGSGYSLNTYLDTYLGTGVAHYNYAVGARTLAHFASQISGAHADGYLTANTVALIGPGCAANEIAFGSGDHPEYMANAALVDAALATMASSIDMLIGYVGAENVMYLEDPSYAYNYASDHGAVFHTRWRVFLEARGVSWRTQVIPQVSVCGTSPTYWLDAGDPSGPHPNAAGCVLIGQAAAGATYRRLQQIETAV